MLYNITDNIQELTIIHSPVLSVIEVQSIVVERDIVNTFYELQQSTRADSLDR